MARSAAGAIGSGRTPAYPFGFEIRRVAQRATRVPCGRRKVGAVDFHLTRGALAAPRDAVQAALGERYDVLTHLATGGMAEVYLARDSRHGRDVAIKLIRDELARSVGADRFLREIAITARLSHPHIRPLLDSGEIDGIPYYVMPFVKGETLRERLAREGTLGLDAALRLTRELADALDYAHREGVVHRDVKPGNIFLESDHALLSDFGVATAAEAADGERLTDSGVVVGTAEYLSPEQCDGGRPVDGRSDLYSLGCVLYEMLTGQPPFTGRTRIAIIAKQIGEPPPSAAVLRPDLPVEVADVLQRCLAKAPGDRYSNARELRDAIDDAIDVLKTGTSRGLAVRTARRERRLTVVRAGLAALVVGAIAVGAWWIGRPDVPPTDTNKVIVFPLVDRGGAGDAGSTVAVMIRNALVYAEPLRALDGYEYMSAQQRVDPATLTLDQQREIALARGAGFFITGGVRLQLDSTSVSLTLHDAAADSTVRSAYSTDVRSAATPDQIGTRALIQLLPAITDPDRVVDMSVLTDRDASAVYLWLLGDLEYRNARFDDALEHYRAAVDQDSLLIFAALKGAQAASWLERAELTDSLSRHAAAHDTILPARYRRFATGLRAHIEGRADEAVTAFRQAIDADPEWSEAWMALGEVYQHLLPSDMRAGAASSVNATQVQSAAAAFARAVSLDPAFSPPLVHLAEYAIRRGANDTAAAMIARLRQSGAGGAARLAGTRMMLACAAGRLDAEAWRNAARTDVQATFEAAGQLAVGALYPECAEAGFTSIFELPDLDANFRWAAALGLQSLFVALGRDSEAQPVLDRAGELTGLGTYLYMPAFDVLAGADLRAGARTTDSIATTRWGPDFASVSNTSVLYVVGIWKIMAGDTAAATIVHDRLATVHARTSSIESGLVLGQIEARLALLNGDTSRAIETLRGLRTVGTRNELMVARHHAFPAERLLLARLLLERGEPEDAYWTAAALDHPQPLLFVAFVPESLVVRYRAAAALPGTAWRARADDARRRLEMLGRTDLLQ